MGSVRGATPALEVLGEHRWRRAGRYQLSISVTDASGHTLAKILSHVTVHAG